MKYFYIGAGILLLALSSYLVVLEQQRDPALPVRQALTPFPIVDGNKDCPQSWFGYSLTKAEANPKTRIKTCSYGGSIAVGACKPNAANEKYAYDSKRHICYQWEREKLVKWIAVQPEPEAPAVQANPLPHSSVKDGAATKEPNPQPELCEKTWLGTNLSSATIGQVNQGTAVRCAYSGAVDWKECVKQTHAKKPSYNAQGQPECVQEQLPQRIKAIALRESLPSGVADAAMTCDKKWLGRKLVSGEVNPFYSREKYCLYEGVISVQECNSAGHRVINYPDGRRECLYEKNTALRHIIPLDDERIDLAQILRRTVPRDANSDTTAKSEPCTPVWFGQKNSGSRSSSVERGWIKQCFYDGSVTNRQCMEQGGGKTMLTSDEHGKPYCQLQKGPYLFNLIPYHVPIDQD